MICLSGTRPHETSTLDWNRVVIHPGKTSDLSSKRNQNPAIFAENTIKGAVRDETMMRPMMPERNMTMTSELMIENLRAS